MNLKEAPVDLPCPTPLPPINPLPAGHTPRTPFNRWKGVNKRSPRVDPSPLSSGSVERDFFSVRSISLSKHRSPTEIVAGEASRRESPTLGDTATGGVYYGRERFSLRVYGRRSINDYSRVVTFSCTRASRCGDFLSGTSRREELTIAHVRLTFHSGAA